MKKMLILFIVLTLVLALAIGCSSVPADEEPEETPGQVSLEDLEDGTYIAEESDFGDSGWKYVVTLEVEDGKIINAEWNGIHEDGGDDKITISESGEYGMVEHGNASAEWHEQAALVEAHLLEIQNPESIEYSTEEGHTDAIAGASIHVKEFFDLAQQALESSSQ